MAEAEAEAGGGGEAEASRGRGRGRGGEGDAAAAAGGQLATGVQAAGRGAEPAVTRTRRALGMASRELPAVFASRAGAGLGLALKVFGGQAGALT